SSRRRHTRSDRDWSSDVCSSDLFRRAAEKDDGNEVRTKSILGRLQERIQDFRNGSGQLGQRKWRGGSHGRPRASRANCCPDARMSLTESQRSAPTESRCEEIPVKALFELEI